jgi:hypothetical protein
MNQGSLEQNQNWKSLQDVDCQIIICWQCSIVTLVNQMTNECAVKKRLIISSPVFQSTALWINEILLYYV